MADMPQGKVFIEGRYRKLTRDLPQTVFFCPECKGHPRRRRKCTQCEGFGKLTRDSVQELVTWVLGHALKTRKNKFHGAGREDIDVRMLGNGRPFVVEFQNPRELKVDLAALEAEVNRRNEGRLEVEGLHWSEKGRIRILKETKHAKDYEALVEVEGDAPADVFAPIVGERLEMQQQTPQRVAHRRADLVRERWIEILGAEPAEDHPGCFRVKIRTQHGTYVKEAVTGEAGRSTPSLASLIGRPCRCVELDVLDILEEDGTPIEIRRAPASFGQGL
jgi:tRNA pseudouridine synthase 10